LVTAPSTTLAGETFNVTITALDPTGATATGYNGAVNLTSTDPEALLPAAGALTGGTGILRDARNRR
jgi:hypothetical protein